MSTVSDGTMPCPVLSPFAGLPCTKRIPEGWTADEGHSGGHCWMSANTEAIFDGGHYDATAAVSGKPFSGHLPEDCTPDCPKHSPPAVPSTSDEDVYQRAARAYIAGNPDVSGTNPEAAAPDLAAHGPFRAAVDEARRDLLAEIHTLTGSEDARLAYAEAALVAARDEIAAQAATVTELRALAETLVDEMDGDPVWGMRSREAAQHLRELGGTDD